MSSRKDGYAMKLFFAENRNKILLLVFISLVFLLWGRVIVRVINENNRICDLTTVQARIQCAASFGWEADPSTETVQKVKIPQEFDEVFEEYNKLQKMCGFDLRRYRGKTAERYTYIVRNFPYETSEPVYVNLYIYQNTMIAGDCMTRALDGFMLPIDRRFSP